MKEGDLILVSAEATGLGKPMEAVSLWKGLYFNRRNRKTYGYDFAGE